MQSKTGKIIYWFVTGLFVLTMLADGIAGVMRVEGGKESFAHLGYPVYFLTILGTAKILGAIAILQTKFRIISEWAYAGFTFNFISAAASHAFVGDGVGMMIVPIIVLAVMFVSYYFWKKLN